MYKKLQAEWDRAHDDSGSETGTASAFNQADWMRRVEEAFGYDWETNFGWGLGSSSGLKPIEELEEAQYAMITQAGEDLYASSMEGFNPLDQESVFSNLMGVGPAYQYGEMGSGDHSQGGAGLQSLTHMMQGTNPLSAQGLRKLHTGYYNPFIQEKRDPLESALGQKRATARAAGGDFAGYGQRAKLEDISKGSYLDKVGGIYSEVDKYREGATQNILDTLGSWEEMSEAYMGD